MRKTYYFFAGCFLAFSVLFLTGCETEKKTLSEKAACSEETDSSEESAAEEVKTAGEIDKEKPNPKTYKNVEKEVELLWAADVEPVQYEMDWEVDGTTETCIRELTKPKYQGSTGASEGNQAVSDWLAEEFQRTGLQQLPGLGSWKQNYSADYEKTKTADNIIGYLPGKDHTKAVVLGAGFGNPNLATLLQTAKWLAKSSELPCDVIFAAFYTEDNSKKGSAALAAYIEKQYVQIRMVNLKCTGWKGQPVIVYGAGSEADLRKSLAGGLGIPYAKRDVGGDEAAFCEENMSSVSLFQDASVSDPKASAVLNTTDDIPENLDFAMLDDIAKKLAAWVIERGDEPLESYVVYW